MKKSKFNISDDEWTEVTNIFVKKKDDLPSFDELWNSIESTREEQPDYCWAAFNTGDPENTVAVYPSEIEALRTANELNGYSDDRWIVKRVRYGFELAEELTNDE